LYQKYDTAPPQNIADYYIRFFWWHLNTSLSE
jgi:hypothetical protein